MHFIGNRAIILGHGEAEIQLVYTPGYSTLSVFLPIIGLSIAFSAAEYPSKSPILHWCLLTCTGVFAGLSIVGMHYIGNFGASTYVLQYKPPYLAASIIIAIGDCWLVLVLFYTLREKWISDWRKRGLCAALLAGGVSAMHFTASTNCIYILKSYSSRSALRSRNVQVIVAGILCGAGAIIFLGVLFFTRHRQRVLKRSSQKVMLACALFDRDGRILVTTEGVLPSREITDKFHHRTFEEEFDKAHPVFHWIFRVTRNWSGVTELIPKMKSHLAAFKEGDESDSPISSSRSSAVYDPETYSDYSVLFRERFCTAASSLAASLHLTLEKIGVLYDDILDTGTLKVEENRRYTLHNGRSVTDVESAFRVNAFGKGQLLFLTRRLQADEADSLLNAGFRFASVQQVGRFIAETLQIPFSTLDLHMTSLKHYVDHLSTSEKTGTWLGCFALIPKPHSSGFDVAVKRGEQDQLPDVQLLPDEPLPWQVKFLQLLDQKTSSGCITFLEDSDHKHTTRTPQEQQFAMMVLQALIRLSQQVPTQWWLKARFHGTPVNAYYSQPLRKRAPVTVMFSLVACADLHMSIESCCGIVRIPLSFLRVRHQCHAASPNNQALARDIHQEFGPLLARRTQARGTDKSRPVSMIAQDSSTNKLTGSTSRRLSTTRTSSDGNSEDSSDAYELVNSPSRRSSEVSEVEVSEGRHDMAWGGILRTDSTVVNSDSKSDSSVIGGGIGFGVGRKVAVSTSKPEETFVDELLVVARGMISSKLI